MMTEAEVFDQFAKDGIKTEYGELYLPKAKALEFISVCEENGLGILGIEGFIEDHESFVPQIDLIADYSLSRPSREMEWVEYRQRCNTAGRRFVERANSRGNLYFTFVVLSHEEFVK